MEEKNLGGGIITCSIIYIIFSFIGFLSNIFLLVGGGFIEEALKETGQQDLMAAISPPLLITSMIICVLMIISLSLLLGKKKIGVYGTFSLVAINILINIITTGFGVGIIVALILPGLLGYFVYKKRSIFGFYDANVMFEDEDEETDSPV